MIMPMVLFLSRFHTYSVRSPSPMTSYSRCVRRTSQDCPTLRARRATLKPAALRRGADRVFCVLRLIPPWPRLKTISTGIISRLPIWCHLRLLTRSVTNHIFVLKTHVFFSKCNDLLPILVLDLLKECMNFDRKVLIISQIA